MRQGFGIGISIPSQQRWIRYVDRWANKGNKIYVERPVEVLEVHCWGLKDGVKIVIEGFVDEGKVIKKFHTFTRDERTVVKGAIQKDNSFADTALQALGRKKTIKDKKLVAAVDEAQKENGLDSGRDAAHEDNDREGGDVIFKPSSRVILPSSDMNIDVERRNKTNLGGLTMVTAVAHVWINTFFEGNGPEQNGKPDDSGVFEIDWIAMDGIKGSSRKGTCAFDKIAVVWKAVDVGKPSVVINEPGEGEEVRQTTPADWRGEDGEAKKARSHALGLRASTSESASVSRASSMQSQKGESDAHGSAEDLASVQPHGPGESKELNSTRDDERGKPIVESPKTTGPHASQADMDPTLMQVDGVDNMISGSGTKHVSTSDLPGGVPEGELKEHHGHALGSLGSGKKTSS